jgi:proteasome lid subunit RPN8/RPN11
MATVEGIVAHCLDSDPLEACGLLVGAAGVGGESHVESFFPTQNAAASARVYEVEPHGLLVADRQAAKDRQDLIGVYHSHTHTEAKPSPTDIRQAPDPLWHYLVVSLRDAHPSLRSWEIAAGKITEEPVVLEW